MLAEIIREARLRAGISQKTIAELLQIDRPTYNKIEQNKIAPKFEDLPKLAQALNIDLKTLQKSMCAHLKNECAHRTTRKSSITTYKLSVALDRSEFAELNKSNLKKCGYKNLEEFLRMAYRQLQNQLDKIKIEESKNG